MIEKKKRKERNSPRDSLDISTYESDFAYKEDQVLTEYTPSIKTEES